MGHTPMLHLYVIHSQQLTSRQPRLHGTIQAIRQIALQLGHSFETILILKSDPMELVPNLQALNSRVSYDSVNDEVFDSQKHVLNIEEISNIEKHRDAWRRMQSLPSSDMFMIIEDDNMLVGENAEYLATIFKQPADTWDFLDLNMSTSAEEMTLNPIYQHTKLLPSKQAYMLSPKAAKLLLQETETIRFNTRTHISYAIHKYKANEMKKSFFPSKRIMLEGSKVGVYPSTLHGSNTLIYNAEYMQLWNMWKDHTEKNIPLDEAKIREIKSTVQTSECSDLHYLIGRLLHKLGHVKEASSIWELALEQHIKLQGMMNQQSELLQEMIANHKNLQVDEVAQYMNTPSKYAVKTVAARQTVS